MQQKSPRETGSERPLRRKKCEWCDKYLPDERYRSRICPDCRRLSLEEFEKTIPLLRAIG